MSVNIRFPNITAFSEKEQIAQIKSYLHQLVEQLNYALPNLGSGNGSTQTASTNTYEVQGGELSYYELRSLIVQELQKLDTMFEELSQKVDVDVDEAVSTLEKAVTDLEQAKANGEFDGADGQDGQNGKDGVDGKDGKTPVYGEDFFLTEDDETSIAKKLASIISFTVDTETGDLYYEYPDNEVVEDETQNNEVEE